MQFPRSLALLCLAFSSIPAQGPVQLPVGVRVRIVVADSGRLGTEFVRVAGQYEGMRGDTLIVDVGGGGVSHIPRPRVASVAVATGRAHPYFRFGALGAVAGFTVGLVAEQTDPRHGECILSPDGLGCRKAPPRLSKTLATVLGIAFGEAFAAAGRTNWVRLDLPVPP